MSPKERTISINHEKITLPQTRGEVVFWGWINKGLDKKESYIKAFPKCNPKWAATYGRKLYNKKKFEPIKQNLWQRFKDDAHQAYDVQKDILEDDTNKAELRNAIADKILDRAGFSAIQKTAQLKMIKHLDNPLLEKSADELKELAKRTTEALKEVKNEMSILNAGKPKMIDGEVEYGE